MATYVLVHGGDVTTETWNKLTKGVPVYTDNSRLGWRVWESIIFSIEKHGHTVFAPTLKNEHDCNLTGHIEQICALIKENNLENVILVGHSYGGMIITGVADRVPDKIRRLVYVDAALPDPEQSLYDFISSAGYNHKSISGLEPPPAYTEKLHFVPERIKQLPKTYIRCTESEFVAVTETAIRKISGYNNKQWTLFELPTGHLVQATMPDELALILLKQK